MGELNALFRNRFGLRHIKSMPPSWSAHPPPLGRRWLCEPERSQSIFDGFPVRWKRNSCYYLGNGFLHFRGPAGPGNGTSQQCCPSFKYAPNPKISGGAHVIIISTFRPPPPAEPKSTNGPNGEATLKNIVLRDGPQSCRNAR